jgi:hypothetical protein
VSVASDVRGLADALPRAVEAALSATALDVKATFLRVATAVSGGDARLSRVGKRGTKIGARYTIIEGGTRVVVRAVGPWQFVEYPRRGGYAIPAKKGKGPNRKRKRPRLLVGGEWRTGPIHGGAITRPEGPWHRATPAALDAAGDRVVDDLLRAVDRFL